MTAFFPSVAPAANRAASAAMASSSSCSITSADCVTWLSAWADMRQKMLSGTLDMSQARDVTGVLLAVVGVALRLLEGVVRKRQH